MCFCELPYVITIVYAFCLTVWVGKSWLKGKAKALELKINVETIKCLQSEAVHHQYSAALSLADIPNYLKCFSSVSFFLVSVSSWCQINGKVHIFWYHLECHCLHYVLHYSRTTYLHFGVLEIQVLNVTNLCYKNSLISRINQKLIMHRVLNTALSWEMSCAVCLHAACTV